MGRFNCGIYKWTNKETGEYYIGQSKNLYKRCSKFLDFSRKYAGKKIDELRERFPSLIYWNYEILSICSPEDLDAEEKYFINENQTSLLLNSKHNNTDSFFKDNDYSSTILEHYAKKILTNKYPFYKKIINNKKVSPLILETVSLMIPFSVSKEFPLKNVEIDYWDDMETMCVTFDITYDELINFIEKIFI